MDLQRLADLNKVRQLAGDRVGLEPRLPGKSSSHSALLLLFLYQIRK
jgi:hypothetical protein